MPHGKSRSTWGGVILMLGVLAWYHAACGHYRVNLRPQRAAVRTSSGQKSDRDRTQRPPAAMACPPLRAADSRCATLRFLTASSNCTPALITGTRRTETRTW
jgi:hypothetical protein